MKLQLIFALCVSLVSSSAMAQLGRSGGGQRANVQNRSANTANANRGANANTANRSANANTANRSANANTANANRNVNNNANRNVNNNANVNRNANVNNNANVNRNVNVNQNVNVNRNVNVNTNGGGCYNCGYDHDNDWNWGSFAVGAAVGVATTAAVSAASQPSTTVVVAPPAVGTMVTTLPGGCATIDNGGPLYNCSNVYYRPYSQGTSLVYQVVTYP
jgi:hypothetical protein